MGEVNYDTYIVIADFEGAAENELSVKVGEKLLVLQSTAEGWSEGYTCGGRQGWFPSAYAKFDPTGKPSDVIGGAANKSMTGASSSNTTASSSLSGSASASSATTSSTAGSSKPQMKAKKKGEKKTAAAGAQPAASPFPGIRHHTAAAAAVQSSPFPGIRHHAESLPAASDKDKEKEKQKKAEEKKKEKERKKKERELKKDLRMASSGLFGVPLKASVAQEQHVTNIPFIVRACVEHILKGNFLLREGLFRISGIKTEIDSLKACFESGVEGDCSARIGKCGD